MAPGLETISSSWLFLKGRYGFVEHIPLKTGTYVDTNIFLASPSTYHSKTNQYRGLGVQPRALPPSLKLSEDVFEELEKIGSGLLD
jgi:hypothetical protein